jgi:hypothetical protein
VKISAEEVADFLMRDANAVQTRARRYVKTAIE